MTTCCRGEVDKALGLPLRKLLARGGSNTRDGGSQATEVRSEKLSDAMLATHEAILKASDKGRWVGCCRTLILDELAFTEVQTICNRTPRHSLFLCISSNLFLLLDRTTSSPAPSIQLQGSGCTFSITAALPVFVTPWHARRLVCCSDLSQLGASDDVCLSLQR